MMVIIVVILLLFGAVITFYQYHSVTNDSDNTLETTDATIFEPSKVSSEQFHTTLPIKSTIITQPPQMRPAFTISDTAAP